MAASICQLSPPEAEQLRLGAELECARHRHCRRIDAISEVENGNARWATLNEGQDSRYHIVETDAMEWRKVTWRTPDGAMSVSSMQLVRLKRGRR